MKAVISVYFWLPMRVCKWSEGAFSFIAILNIYSWFIFLRKKSQLQCWLSAINLLLSVWSLLFSRLPTLKDLLLQFPIRSVISSCRKSHYYMQHFQVSEKSSLISKQFKPFTRLRILKAFYKKLQICIFIVIIHGSGLGKEAILHFDAENVPMSLCLLILLMCTCGGAYIFQ
jgi:hypothetical protein